MRARLIRALAFLRVARPVHTSRMPQIDVHIRSLPTCATLPGTIAPGRPGRFVRWLALESISTLRMMSTLSQLLALSLLPQAAVALTTRVEVPRYGKSLAFLRGLLEQNGRPLLSYSATIKLRPRA